ncbi:fibronectin type III domain-containing protein [Nocardioides pocheonensis]|uniref:Fibronectin type-III domain-containing protein n=1 Tax=Nocardioides pocheonensis TaxID=661485 RepID=A0A3N0GV73_9ACTN|nr:zinc-dependent metalloprotease family protein [Nocardioides pocheonensis]RNM16355.1 hypothetical protein EFL26_05250 [Nocardioides pocheonensis]
MHPGLRSALALTGALALLGPTTHAVADTGGTPAPHSHVLARAGHGAAVVKALGDKLPAAAATNRMSPARLAAILESDPTAWLGPDGQMFYQETAQTLSAADATTQVAAASLPLSQTFALHSLPGSTHTIFLDFDGADVTGTWWNDNKGLAPGFHAGFSIDGDYSTFSSAELAYIQQVWQIVAEKYSPFDVDVTTQDPGPDAYNRAGLSDPTYGDHVVISDDAAALNATCGGGCSGVALVNTFDSTWRSDSYLEPAWVFSSMTSGSAVLTAETIAHEVGHTFGLHHDGDATHEYSSGHGNWFPLMGSSIRAVGQFSIGEYAGANNTEDDLALIAKEAPLRLDDRSNGMLLAEPLATGTLVDGVISTRTDQDVFVVNHPCNTNLVARATGIGAGASLDMSVTVLDSGGSTVAYGDPTSGQNALAWPYTPIGLDATATVSSAASGVYYVRIDGVGKGDPLTDGYSDYASVGQYQLAVSSCDGSLPVPTTPVTVTTTPTAPTSHPATATTPSAPGIGLASSGRRGHPITAVARWNAPASNGGAAITGYRVRAERLSRSGRVVGSVTSRLVGSGTHALTLALPQGRYRFRIVAYNQAGASPYSSASRVVVAR